MMRSIGAGEVRFIAWSAAIAFASGSTTVAVPSGCWQLTSWAAVEASPPPLAADADIEPAGVSAVV